MSLPLACPDQIGIYILMSERLHNDCPLKSETMMRGCRFVLGSAGTHYQWGQMVTMISVDSGNTSFISCFFHLI